MRGANEPMKSYRLTKPPAAIRRAQRDNLALVPASLLPFKKQWQQLANKLPHGSTLIILPSSDRPQRKACEHVAADLRGRGKHVTTLPAEQFH